MAISHRRSAASAKPENTHISCSSSPETKKKLTETLTEAQKEIFEKFKDSTLEISSITEVTAFTLGFKLGLRLTAETFISSDQKLET